MSLASAEEAEATRRSWREEVQWNIARRDEALKAAKEIGGEHLTNPLILDEPESAGESMASA